MNNARSTVRALQAVDTSQDDGKRLAPRSLPRADADDLGLGTEIEQAHDFGPAAVPEVDMDFQPGQKDEPEQAPPAPPPTDEFKVDMTEANNAADLVSRVADTIEKVYADAAARRKTIEGTIAAITARREKRRAFAEAEFERDMAIAQAAMKQATICFEGADLFRGHVAKNK